ncbi:DMT family transporter [Aestuariispira insulae]|uniref:Drug/metabolite transporter (DMT)-like permease n=1 Tax=Aestuariispira insulae TaxID=1461337 RepID=A0A3D9HH73_9PROT|nr:DMT family transporter [Aestuariispira insulae]RED48611.1 drug/metabolite transporter (DMT)-like permease [Aestuariispira insulae]
MTAFLYILTVFLWGTTWIAIKFQVGTVPLEASVLYRFAIAGAVLFVILLATGRLQRIGWRHQPYLLALGLCLFCFNFLGFYNAAEYVVSGLMAVIFSSATIFNVANAYLFHRRVPTARTVAGAAIGLCGLCLLFWHDLIGQNASPEMIAGIAIAMGATYLFSLGNMISARNQKAGLDVASANAYAMVYGVAALSLVGLVSGVDYSFDPSPLYVGSLLYLAVPGSVIAFTTYLTVVGRIGPEKAGYMTILFPLVALSISTFLEGYQWTPEAIVGLVAILCGNFLVLTKGRGTPAVVAQKT